MHRASSSNFNSKTPEQIFIHDSPWLHENKTSAVEKIIVEGKYKTEISYDGIKFFDIPNLPIYYLEPSQKIKLTFKKLPVVKIGIL